MSSPQQDPAEGPDDPAYTGEGRDGHDQAQDQGQVSEVANLAAEGIAPITPGDSVAGAPDGESGEVQEDGAGPDAKPRYNEETNEFAPD